MLIHLPERGSKQVHYRIGKAQAITVQRVYKEAVMTYVRIFNNRTHRTITHKIGLIQSR